LQQVLRAANARTFARGILSGARRYRENLAGSAWDSDTIVGLALATTDFRTLTCVTDVTVDVSRSREGLADDLVRCVHQAVPDARTLVVAASRLETYDPTRAMISASRESNNGRVEREPPWLHTIDTILATEFPSKLTVGRLSSRLGIHRVHISRTFFRLRHESIVSALRRRRIDAACRYLMSDDAALAGISLDVGFSDQAQFSRAFKQITGTTPGAFRALFRHHPVTPPAFMEEELSSRVWRPWLLAVPLSQVTS
jgi:AraC-like DNA-binding protein